ncbi:MAG: DNA primase [Planctomycetota bacterium]
MSSNSDYDVKDRVKQANDVVDLVGSMVTLRRQGSIFVGHCPWHDDSRPSFQVNPARQSWACWPCDIRGDVFDFMMRWEQVDFRESLRILAERANIDLRTSFKKIVKGSPEDKNTLYKAMQWAEEVYHQCLLESDAASPIRDYLAERGVSSESIDTFKIGFAPLSWSWLVDQARHTEFTPKVLEACGLVSPSRQGSWHERFRGRVLFPIRDTLDRPIAIGGRVVPRMYDKPEDIPPAKYVNSPETKLFSKSKNLYALNLCRTHIQKADSKSLTIVEGYTDVIAAWQAGLRNVVAALGTAINEQHVRLVKRFAPDGITLVLDGDEAGKKKSNAVLDLFVAEDIDLRILTLPEGLDPFDYLMDKGAEKFNKMVATAPDAIGHKILEETRGVDLLNDTHRANQALENVLMTLARIPQRLLAGSEAKKMRHEQIVIRLARQFQLMPERIHHRLAEIRKSMRTGVKRENKQQEQRLDISKFDRVEAELIQLLVQAPALLDTAIENVTPDEFQDGPLQDLYRVMEDFFHDGKDVGYEQLMLELEDLRLKGLLDYLYDEAIAKKQAAEESQSEFHADLESQMLSIVGRFQEDRERSGIESRISQLHAGTLDADAEAQAMLEALQAAREMQRKKNPK